MSSCIVVSELHFLTKKMSSLRFHAAKEENRLLGPYFLKCLTGTICCGFLWDNPSRAVARFGSTDFSCMMVFHISCNCSLEHVSGTKEGQDGPMAWSAHFPDLNSLHFIFGGIQSPLFMLQKSVVFRTCNKEYTMDFRWFVQHLEFFSQAITVWTCKCPALKLKVKTFDIFFTFQEAMTWEHEGQCM